MNIEFKFLPGEVVKNMKNGFIAVVTHSALSASGNVYFQKNDYHQQWSDEADLKKAELPGRPHPDAAPEKKGNPKKNK